MTTTTLFRPLGAHELKRIAESGFCRFPPRWPEQPVFHAVCSEAHAFEIAERWNLHEARSSFVTKFEVPASFLAAFKRGDVGAPHGERYSIPGEDLEALNAAIVGPITVVRSFVSSGAVADDVEGAEEHVVEGGGATGLVLAEGVAVDSEEALVTVTHAFRQVVAYLARSPHAGVPASPEARLAEQVVQVLAVCAARGTSGDKEQLRKVHALVFKSDLLRPAVLDAVTRAVEAAEEARASVEGQMAIAGALRDDLVALHDDFDPLDVTVIGGLLKKSAKTTYGAGRYSPAKVAAAICLSVGAFGAQRTTRDGKMETVDEARTRIAKSFRPTRARPK